MSKMSDLAIDQEIEKRAELDRQFQERIDSGEIVEPSSRKLHTLGGLGNDEKNVYETNIPKQKEPTCRFGHQCSSGCQKDFDCPCTEHCCGMNDCECEDDNPECRFAEEREAKALLASKDFFKTANRDALKGLDMRTSMEAQEDERLNPLDL